MDFGFVETPLEIARLMVRLSMKKECLEKSQSFEDYRGCMTQFRKERTQ
jgi:hypothetical protein